MKIIIKTTLFIENSVLYNINIFLGETTLPPRFNKEDAYELELFMSELKCLKVILILKQTIENK